MFQLSIKNIEIEDIRTNSGYFVSNENRFKKIEAAVKVNEVFGTVAGSENLFASGDFILHDQDVIDKVPRKNRWTE